ncbi:MAG TPA: hypothetical protein DCY94_03585, partial [Firmicutes bacterium]|nr:hypothetical protein [Bacillota bacterium]
KFDPEKGIFSTFACNWIRAAIGRGIDDHDDMIRRPTHFVNKRIKFAKLQRQNELEGKTLEASDIKGKLNITDEMLELLETDYQNEVKSLDETIIRQSPEDGEPTYLELIASDKHDSRNDMVKI